MLFTHSLRLPRWFLVNSWPVLNPGIIFLLLIKFVWFYPGVFDSYVLPTLATLPGRLSMTNLGGGGEESWDSSPITRWSLSLSAKEGLWGTREGKRQPSFDPVHFPHWLTQNFYQPSKDKNRTVSHNRRSRRNGLGKRIFSLLLSTKFQVSILVVPASSRHRWGHGVQRREDSWGPQSFLHLLTQWLWNSLKF